MIPNPILHTKIGKDQYAIEYKDCTIGDLMVFIASLETELASIRSQLANINYEYEGAIEWEKRTKVAMQAKKTHVGVLKSWITAKEAQESDEHAIAKAFMQAAYENLDPDDYDDIMFSANQILKDEQE